MINLRKHIYETLKNNNIAWENVFTWNEDEIERKDWQNVFPQITFDRISSNMRNNTVGLRVETWQISAWANSLLEAETMSEKIIEIFNRSENVLYKSCSLIEVANTYDNATKTHGSHTRWHFLVYSSKM